MTEQTVDQDAANDPAPAAEIVPFTPREQQQIERKDLRDRITDSWTSVVEDVAFLANRIAGSDFVPEAYRGKPGQVAATMLHGRELGMPPMTALAVTNPIKGKPSIAAEAMRALVFQAGHSIRFSETSSSRCVILGRRKGDEDWTTVTWTMDDVRKAAIRNPNYTTYPRQMLEARATAELCRLIFPDVIHGLRAAEELLDDLESVTGPPPAPEPVKTTTVQRKPRKKAEPKPEPDETSQEKDEAPAPAPERKRAELPHRKPAPPTPRGSNDDDEAAAPPEQPQPAAPSSEQQRAEIRRLSEERRNLNAAAAEPGRDDEASDDGEVVDAEIVTGPATGPKMSAQQRGAVMMHWGRLGMMEDRDERLLLTCTLLGLEPGSLKSTSDLTSGQAVELLGIVERFKDRDAIDAYLNGQGELV